MDQKTKKLQGIVKTTKKLKRNELGLSQEHMTIDRPNEKQNGHHLTKKEIEANYKQDIPTNYIYKS